MHLAGVFEIMMTIKSFITDYLLVQTSILYLVFISLCLLVYRTIFYPLLSGHLRHVPGPWINKITSLHLVYYDLIYCRNTEILKWHQLYGPVVCISPNEISVATVEAVREVYTAARGWSKSDYFDNFTGYNQRSVFATKSYNEHREKRKLISAFYQATTIYKLPELEQHVQNRCQAVLKLIEQVQEADVYTLTDWYAFDVITYLVYGPSHSSHCTDGPCQERTIIEKLKYFQFSGPFRVRFPHTFSWVSSFLIRLSTSLSYLRAEEDLADWCRERTSMAANDSMLFTSRSLLRHLSQGKMATSSPSLDNDFVAAELLDNINAARATVAVTATYLIWLLSEHPVWQSRVRDELSALPVQSDGSTSFADVNNRAPVLEACLREVYRLYPASSGRAERIVPQGGCTLSNVHLPAGTIVTSSILALHRDETIFPDPDKFDPRRWLDDKAHGAVLKAREAQLMPFGYGGRICLGIAIATMEIKLLVAALCLRFELVPSPSCLPELMWQCSTHDAVPRSVECMVEFRRLIRTQE